MAKASQRDLDAAIELYQFLEAMRDGRPASDAVDEFGYEGYGDLLERAALRQAGDAEFLLRAHERGGLFRVAWGMQVLLDPANEVVDPNLPHLELHPKHEQAAKDRDAARAELAAVKRQRDEFAEHIATKPYNNVRDGACQQCFPWAEVSGDFVCVPHKAAALAAEQPKPQQPQGEGGAA